MNKILECLLDLNKHLMLEGFYGDYTITLSGKDFERFVYMFETKHKGLLSYPELAPSPEQLNQVKLAGPGCYFHIERKRS